VDANERPSKWWLPRFHDIYCPPAPNRSWILCPSLQNGVWAWARQTDAHAWSVLLRETARWLVCQMWKGCAVVTTLLRSWVSQPDNSPLRLVNLMILPESGWICQMTQEETQKRGSTTRRVDTYENIYTSIHIKQDAPSPHHPGSQQR